MFQVAILSVGTLLTLAVAFAGVVIVAYLTYAYSGRVLQVLLLIIAIVSVLSTLLTGRVLRLGDSGLDMFLEGGVGNTLVGKVLLLILAGIAFSVCFAWWLWRFRTKRPPYRYNATGLVDLNTLTWAVVCYFVVFSLLPLAFAPRFEFHVSLVYPVFVWLALLLALRASAVDPLRILRQALSMIVIVSLAAAVLLPSLALQPGYSSLIPGFSMRLWGATAHANTLGSIAGTLLVLQFMEKPNRLLLHHLISLIAVIALVLTQSKSAIGGAFLGLGILFAWRIWRGSSDHSPNARRVMIGTAILSLLSALLVGVLWVAVADSSVLHAIERRLDPRAVGGVATLTGRVEIWEYALRRGLESPWFGHGLSMWDLQTRLSTGLHAAMHAHNLYLQSFSRAGLLGLLALLLLLFLIVRNAVRSVRVSAGGSLALLAMFLVRSVTEVPLQPNSVLGGEFFAFMALLLYTADRAILRNEFVSSIVASSGAVDGAASPSAKLRAPDPCYSIARGE